MLNFNYVPLGKFHKEPPEGRKGIAFSVDLSAILSETVDIGLTGIQLSQLRSLYVANNDAAANLTITVVGTNQVITCGAGKTVYVPLFTAVPCRLVFTTNVNTTSIIQCVVCNFDLDTIKPNNATLSASDLSNGVVGVGAIVLASALTAATPNFVGEEIPAGAIDGVNNTFNLAFAPVAGSLFLFLNGMKMIRGTAFTLAGNVITFLAGWIPQVGDSLEAYYRK